MLIYRYLTKKYVKYSLRLRKNKFSNFYILYIGFKYIVTVKSREPKVTQCNAKLTNVEDVILADILNEFILQYTFI